ncbi:MAG: HipA N-terminal domain-containing protein [Leptospirales bacterium]
MTDLLVKKGHIVVGTLTDTDTGPIFRYSPEWLSSDQVVPLSGVLPLGTETYSGDVCRSFFENLIPEGREREILGKAFKVSGFFGFLKQFGRDLVGGYSVEESSASGIPAYLPVERKTLNFCPRIPPLRPQAKRESSGRSWFLCWP